MSKTDSYKEKRNTWLQSESGRESMKRGNEKYTSNPINRAKMSFRSNHSAAIRLGYIPIKDEQRYIDLFLDIKAGNRKCEICGGIDDLYIDHNHDTGEIRGVLCFTCNVGLGKLEKYILEVVQYLSYYRR